MGRVIRTLDLADYHASTYCAYIIYLTVITPRATIDPCSSLQLDPQVLITQWCLYFPPLTPGSFPQQNHFPLLHRSNPCLIPGESPGPTIPTLQGSRTGCTLGNRRISQEISSLRYSTVCDRVHSRSIYIHLNCSTNCLRDRHCSVLSMHKHIFQSH